MVKLKKAEKPETKDHSEQIRAKSEFIFQLLQSAAKSEAEGDIVFAIAQLTTASKQMSEKLDLIEEQLKVCAAEKAKWKKSENLSKYIGRVVLRVIASEEKSLKDDTKATNVLLCNAGREILRMRKEQEEAEKNVKEQAQPGEGQAKQGPPRHGEGKEDIPAKFKDMMERTG